MADGRISKDKLPQLIDAVSKEYAVYGPKAHGDIIAFRRIGSADEIKLDYRNSTMSPKELFLPRTEVVYEFNGQSFVDEALPDQKRVVIGMRPCDCRALATLDRVFDAEEQVKDPFYVTRRANTIVVALGCNRPLSTCFCTALGGDPFGEEGADVLLGDADGFLLAKALTSKGKEFLTAYKKFFSEKGSGDWKSLAGKARKMLKTELTVNGSESRLKERFEHDIWETVSRKCHGCGTCAYLCPTCYCFDLTDKKTAVGAKKVRRWDCCMFPSFTLHVSSHNPRPVKAARLRQRIMHKFSYYTESYGVSSCVGCGRCVRSCPVNLDIRQVLEEVMAAPNAAEEK